jgi:hypothetical protein
MRSDKDKLRNCPTCGQSATDLGMRDYSRWLFDTLPGKAGASDLDCVIERRGHFLMFEFKPTKYIPRGQALMFSALAAQGWTVYVVVDKDFPHLQVYRWGTPGWQAMTVEQVQALVLQWWEEVSNG